MERRTKTAEQRFLELIAGPPQSVSSRLLRSILRIASWGYGAGVDFRNRLFDSGIMKSHAVTAPVISIGNLTTGGTGKTPTVALLVDLLKELGHQPGIVSRGYRELSEGGNDEARVLELLCPGTPHVQNRDRVAAAREIVTRHGCSVILADDAFQHRRLKRDLDIVLIDALNPWGHGALLPRGLLREPVSQLRRAELVILTRADLVDDASRATIWELVKENNQSASTVELIFEPAGLVDKTGTKHSVEEFNQSTSSAGQSTGHSGTLAFCGIGNPDGFRRTLAAAGISVQDLIAFPDHHHYDANDLQNLATTAAELQASALVTTVKDLVKIQPEWVSDVPLFALEIRAGLTAGESSLSEKLSQLTQPPTL